MSLPIEIKDGRGGNHKVQVTERGQLVVAPLEFSVPYFHEMTVDNQVYNFIEPKAGKQFVVTGLLVNADRNVGPNGTIVHIYQANGPTSSAAKPPLITMDLARSSTLPMTSLNAILSPGSWLNADTTDNNVFLTVIGYYVDTVG